MNLCLDIGNTRTKAAVFGEQNQMLQHLTYTGLPTPDEIIQLIEQYHIINAIVSSVGTHHLALIESIKENIFLVLLSSQTPIPITNAYQTPQTLGNDRLAAVVGAHDKFPQTDLLVIDAGTCITYDYINANGSYLGGAISPGISIKFKALHTFTQQLPFIDININEIDFPALVGNNTYNSILSGVIVNTISEIDGTIERYKQEYNIHKVILTGGDTFFFENRLKNRIFACPNLVPEGLNKILQYNVGNI